MNEHGPWTTDDFDELSWHDVHVHAFRLDSFDEATGTADLLLDLDFLLEWGQDADGFWFIVCPACLRFLEVFALRMSLDYESPTAGMCPFSIHQIRRKPLENLAQSESYRWQILINWPKGEIAFQASGFTQVLTGTPRRHRGQWLESAERSGVGAA